MNLTDLIGTLAAILTTVSFLPQAMHTFRTKDVRGISLGMYSAFTLGGNVAGVRIDAGSVASGHSQHHHPGAGQCHSGDEVALQLKSGTTTQHSGFTPVPLTHRGRYD